MGVHEVLGFTGLAAHLVGLPQGAEVRAALAEFGHEAPQTWVVWVEAHGCPQVRHGGLGGPVPACVEPLSRGVEEGHAGQVVHRAEWGEQRVGEGVGGQYVQDVVEHEGGGVRVAVHELPQFGAHGPGRRRGCVRPVWRLPAGTGARGRRGRDPVRGRGRRAPAVTGGSRGPVPGGCSSRRSPRRARRLLRGAVRSPCAVRNRARPRLRETVPRGALAGTHPAHHCPWHHGRSLLCPVGWVRHTQPPHVLPSLCASPTLVGMTSDIDVAGMWVTADGYIRQELRADGRYDEDRAASGAAPTPVVTP